MLDAAPGATQVLADKRAGGAKDSHRASYACNGWWAGPRSRQRRGLRRGLLIEQVRNCRCHLSRNERLLDEDALGNALGGPLVGAVAGDIDHRELGWFPEERVL